MHNTNLYKFVLIHFNILFDLIPAFIFPKIFLTSTSKIALKNIRILAIQIKLRLI